MLDVEVYVADRESKNWLTYLIYKRMIEAPPFNYCGVFMFGPFYIMEKRSELWRYGAMFVYLSSRAVHIDVVLQIDNDSFILVLQVMSLASYISH